MPRGKPLDYISSRSIVCRAYAREREPNELEPIFMINQIRRQRPTAESRIDGFQPDHHPIQVGVGNENNEILIMNQ